MASLIYISGIDFWIVSSGETFYVYIFIHIGGDIIKILRKKRSKLEIYSSL